MRVATCDEDKEYIHPWAFSLPLLKNGEEMPSLPVWTISKPATMSY